LPAARPISPACSANSATTSTPKATTKPSSTCSSAEPARFEFDTTSIVLQQQTDYPQTGNVKITVSSDHGRTGNEQSDITISVRIPAWAAPTVRINGEHPDITKTANGYLKLHRTWSPGDD
jgi:DUF1680 family protein